MERHPIRCIGCGTIELDADLKSGNRTDAVMTMPRFWIKATDQRGNRIGPGYAYAICNACLNREIGVLWKDDGTVGRVWFPGDLDVD